MALFRLRLGLGRVGFADAGQAALGRLRRAERAIQNAGRIQRQRDRLAEMAKDLHVVRHHMQRFRARVGCDHFAAVQDVRTQLHQQVFKLVAFRIFLGTQEMGHGIISRFARTISQMY